jgi:ribosome-binding factor A
MQHLRRDRVGDQVKREIAHLIQFELKDPGIGFVTITDVSMSLDLKHARVFYTVLGDEDCKNKTASALKRARGFIQRTVGKRLQLRYTPEISFDFDTSVEQGAHIEQLIQQIHTDENPVGSETAMNGDLSGKPYSDEDEKDE